MLPPNNIQPNFIETKAFAFAPQSHNSHYTHFWAMLITPQNHSPFRRYWGRRKEGKKLAHTHTHRHTHRHTDTHTHTHTDTHTQTHTQTHTDTHRHTQTHRHTHTHTLTHSKCNTQTQDSQPARSSSWEKCHYP